MMTQKEQLTKLLLSHGFEAAAESIHRERLDYDRAIRSWANYPQSLGSLYPTQLSRKPERPNAR